MRNAIGLASTDAKAGKSDTITFAPNLAGQVITLTQRKLDLNTKGSGTITIDGLGTAYAVGDV